MYALSTKLNKVFRSTLAAENLALDEGCETGIYVSKILDLLPLTKKTPILAITDNHCIKPWTL